MRGSHCTLFFTTNDLQAAYPEFVDRPPILTANGVRGLQLDLHQGLPRHDPEFDVR